MPEKKLPRGPFRSRDAVASGVLTAGQLRSSRLRRLYPGVYLDASVDVGYGLRISGARLILPAGAVLAGASAAWAHGADVAPLDGEVEVVWGPGRQIRGAVGIRVRRDQLGAGEVVDTPLGRATSPGRTAFDLGRRGPLPEAVAGLDAVLRATGADVGGVLTVVNRHPRARHLRLLRVALELTDPRAESPRESWLRVVLALGGLPPPEVQYRVRLPDRRIVRLDLAWPRHRVGVEYDGAGHGERRAADLRRHNSLRQHGWVVLQVDAEAARDPAAVVRMVADTLTTRAPRPLA